MRSILRLSDYRRTPWKNGLGWTDQIAIHPPEADLKRGDFLWRISTAHIAQSSPFSLFPEHDRLLVVLEGVGLRLSHSFIEGEPEDVIELPPLEPYEFPGDVPTQCELLDGPIQDFSIFVRKGIVSVNAKVIAIDADESYAWEPQGRTGLAFVVQGEVENQGEIVKTGESLRIDLTNEPAAISILLRSAGSEPCALILIQLDFA